jgi:hypothetical protein
MSQRFNVTLAASLTVVAVAGVILNGHSMLNPVIAAESVTASAQNQLKQKLLDKKQLLEQVLNEKKYLIDQGRGSIHSLEYRQAQEAVLRVDIELCDSKDERAKIYNRIIQFYAEREKQIEVRMMLSQAHHSIIREAKLDRLDIEIEMLKDQLN